MIDRFKVQEILVTLAMPYLLYIAIPFYIAYYFVYGELPEYW